MSADRVQQIVRHFQENGLQQVLTSPANVRDLLTLTQTAVLPRLEFASMTVEATTFVTAEYRHVSSDLVLTLTRLPSKKGSPPALREGQKAAAPRGRCAKSMAQRSGPYRPTT